MLNIDICLNYAIRTPIKVDNSNKEIRPVSTEMMVEVINPKGKTWLLRALLDTGTTKSLVLKDFVTLSQVKQTEKRPTIWHTAGGNFTTNKLVEMEFRIPEMALDKRITWPCYVNETAEREKSPYDIILGLDFIEKLGFQLDFTDKMITWEDHEMPMKPQGFWDSKVNRKMAYTIAQQNSALEAAEERQDKILDADYSKVDLDEYVATLTHLSADQRAALAGALAQYPVLFGGGLGRLKIDPIHLELKPDAKPYHAKPFGIPHALKNTTVKEINRFCELGIWKRVKFNDWTAGTFIQPKKTGDVRVLTDFRKLNEYLVRKPHPLPKPSEMLLELEGFKWATALDLSMGYYHIPLDKPSQRLCGTCMPWGLYQYTVLPMGISNAPDIFQSIMNRLLGDLPYVHVYMDDILITSDGSFEDHLNKLKIVLQRLQDVDFRANVRKCNFATDSVEYLGYIISRKGIHPQPKKVEAIHKMQAPTNRRQLRRFLGMVNYYRDMWQKRSHILAPLTALSSKKAPWKWTEQCQQAFDTIKRVISKETLLAFPDFSKEFHVYTDASDYQLGAVIMQENKPIAFYSRKLNTAQKNYTTGEQELLSIVETLKEFRNILFGQNVTVHTDHLNLLYSKMPSARIVRWRLMLEEFGPKFVHVKGESNVVADTLSRHPNTDPEDTTEELGPKLAYCMAILPRDDAMQEEFSFAGLVTKEDIEDEVFPLSPKVLDRYQRKDKALLKKAMSNPKYSTIELEGTELIAKYGKVVVPLALQDRLIDTYHQLLVHPGANRMEATIRHVFDFKGLRTKVEEHCRTCHICQLTKKQRKKYGLLPAKAAEVIPWKRVNVDLVGPYTVKTKKGRFTLNALTMIDPVTGWFEIAPLAKRNAYEVQKAFDSYWLARYPRPKEVGMDNGSEFKMEFSDLVENYGMTKKPSTAYNPQSNGVIERVHQVLGNALRTFELEERELDTHNPWDEFLTSAAYAIRSTHHTTLQASPAQLVYGRDMLLPVKFVADWTRIQQQKQMSINKSNEAENKKRIRHKYARGDRVLLTTPGKLKKLSRPRTGPYPVVTVHDNGTVTIQRDHIQQRVNIRRLQPYVPRS